jgi:hypothetical protein
VFTPEQSARRKRLRRIVVGIVVGLAPLALAAGVFSFARHGHAAPATANRTLPDAKPLPPPPVATLAPTAEATPLAAPTALAPATLPVAPALAEHPFDWRAFSSLPAPDAALLSAWMSATKQLTHADFVLADRALAHATNKGNLGHREAARLARAILWNNSGYPRAAHNAFVQLAEHARTPLVLQDARAALAAK